MTLEIPEIEKMFKENKFNRIIAKIINEEDQTYFKTCYKKVSKGHNTSYELDGALTADQRWHLWDIYCRAEPDILGSVFADEIVAYYFYLHRQQMGRIADRMDDLFKANYLNYLIKYFKQKRGRVIPLRAGDEKMKKIMDMVYNIYDRAYFHKKEHSGYSDLECFAEAERYYCVEKALDYLAYLESLNRRKKGLVGDECSDYKAAEKNYEVWRKNIGE